MLTIKNILVPTDFSSTSTAAVRHGVELANAFGARLYLLHVPGPTGESFEADFPVGEFETTVRESIEPFFTAEELARCRPEYALRVGRTAAEIVGYAKDREIDLIVMGTHGRTGLSHLVMGSVAEAVVRAAPCPITLVRETKPVRASASHAQTGAVHTGV